MPDTEKSSSFFFPLPHNSRIQYLKLLSNRFRRHTKTKLKCAVSFFRCIINLWNLLPQHVAIADGFKRKLDTVLHEKLIYLIHLYFAFPKKKKKL